MIFALSKSYKTYYFSQEAEMPDYWEKSYSNLLQEITNPSIQISGTYRLAHRDEKFGDFLESLGMSRSHLTYLDKMDENLTIFEGTKSNPNWTMVLKTGELE